MGLTDAIVIVVAVIVGCALFDFGKLGLERLSGVDWRAFVAGIWFVRAPKLKPRKPAKRPAKPRKQKKTRVAASAIIS